MGDLDGLLRPCSGLLAGHLGGGFVSTRSGNPVCDVTVTPSRTLFPAARKGGSGADFPWKEPGYAWPSTRRSSRHFWVGGIAADPRASMSRPSSRIFVCGDVSGDSDKDDFVPTATSRPPLNGGFCDPGLWGGCTSLDSRSEMRTSHALCPPANSGEIVTDLLPVGELRPAGAVSRNLADEANARDTPCDLFVSGVAQTVQLS